MVDWYSAGKWYLTNTDSRSTLEGQFPLVDLSKEISNNYVEKTAPSREDPITQFVHGNSREFSFTGRFFLVKNIVSTPEESAEQKKNVSNIAKTVNQTVKEFGLTKSIYGINYEPEEKLQILENWMRVDPKLRRPPLCFFYTAGNLIQEFVIVEKLSIKYKQFENWTNKLKHVEFELKLKTYDPFFIEGDAEVGKTYYHTVKNGDYYELVSSRVYGNAKLGDVIRKQNSDKPFLREAYRVGFPRIDKISTEVVSPKSIPFRNVFTKKTNTDKERWKEIFESRNGVYYSNVE